MIEAIIFVSMFITVVYLILTGLLSVYYSSKLNGKIKVEHIIIFMFLVLLIYFTMVIPVVMVALF